MPLEVSVNFKNGGQQTYFIPLLSMHGSRDSQEVTTAEAWPWTHPNYDLEIRHPYSDIRSVVIDGLRSMADVDTSNNEYQVAGKQGEDEEK
ncbi:MAG: hypothetical protein U5L96_01595 [Owenweeksia sp.]|nr:hypothetical protein [Owenweeksia sp.]